METSDFALCHLSSVFDSAEPSALSSRPMGLSQATLRRLFAETRNLTPETIDNKTLVIFL